MKKFLMETSTVLSIAENLKKSANDLDAVSSDVASYSIDFTPEFDFIGAKEKLSNLVNTLAENSFTIVDYLNKAVTTHENVQSENSNFESNLIMGSFTAGGLVSPCPNYKRVSSPFGNRLHPIYKTYRFHAGVDLAADANSPIYAASSGKVIEARYNSSMGNYVKIDHGNGYVTIYEHCNSLIAKTGDTVNAGDLIAKVGSTGSSTGNHLHFQVNYNGSPIEPTQFLPKK